MPGWARFLRITLPLLRPSLFLCAVIGLLNSFTSFDLVFVMTNGGPGHATELLVTYIYKLGFGQTRFDAAAAVTVVQFLLLLALTFLANRAAGGDAGALERVMKHPVRHAAMVLVSALMLLPFYWVIRTAITNDNIYAYPPHLLPREPAPLQLRRRLVPDPVPALPAQQRDRLRARRRRQHRPQRHGRLRAYPAVSAGGARCCCCCCPAC